MVQRVCLRRRLSYNTKSNKKKIIRTPGGRLVFQYVKKKGTIPRCGKCKYRLRGIKAARPYERKRMARHFNTVKRTHGGSLCHKCVREKIIRAFLLEEQKIVVKMLKAQKVNEKLAKKADKKPIKAKLDKEKAEKKPKKEVTKTKADKPPKSDKTEKPKTDKVKADKSGDKAKVKKPKPADSKPKK